MKLHPAPPPHPGRFGHALLIFRSLLELLVLAIFVATFIAAPAHIPSTSMWPTLRPGDLLLADLQSFSAEGHLAFILPPTAVHRGDIVIFHYPVHPHTDLIKRVVGLPGDRIRLEDGRVLLNSAPLPEPYAFYSPSAADLFRDDFPSLRTLDPEVDPAWWARLRQSMHGGEITVPPDSFFVLGDNRNDSTDSRYWGFVPRIDLVGRPLVVYLPAPDPMNPAPGVAARFASLARNIRIVR